MTTDADRSIEVAFAGPACDHPTLTGTDRSLMAAFERLMIGRAEITDGRV
jgi:hypothetical protein